VTIDLRRLSRLMSLVLRHEPDRFGIVLDAEGFVPLVDLVNALQAQAPGVRESEIRAVVDTVEPAKQRFSIEGEEIRANYGHSVEGRIAHEVAVPPALLFHGTAVSALASILSSGLHPMRRQYVHLTEDRSLALRVGARHGIPALVSVDAKRAQIGGVLFYRANRSFWLTDHVPAQYLSGV
jgi:putative RNA 2'-phosphotransferase